METAFQKKVYALCSRVPRGKVTTYKEIGDAIGGGVYRAVGAALKCNPRAPVVPCHRVVASDGGIGGFHGETAGPMIAKKMRLLQSEGVRVENGRIVDFGKKLHKF
jgi:methylated-DNA-[protein]-cysteine S-methyltransferase